MRPASKISGGKEVSRWIRLGIRYPQQVVMKGKEAYQYRDYLLFKYFSIRLGIQVMDFIIGKGMVMIAQRRTWF